MAGFELKIIALSLNPAAVSCKLQCHCPVFNPVALIDRGV